MTPETFWFVKANDAGLLPWTCASSRQESMDLFEAKMGCAWPGEHRKEWVLVPVDCTERKSIFAGIRAELGDN